MPVLERKTQLLINEETTSGTKSPPADTDIMRISNLGVTPQITMVNRELLSEDLSSFKSLTGDQQAGMTFTVEMKGGGVATAPEWSDALRGCGFSEAVGVADVDWTLISDDSLIKTMSMEARMDGRIFSMAGARGNVNFDFERGAVPKMNFTYQGTDFDEADGALVGSPSYDTIEPPVVLGVSAMTVDGDSFKINKMTLDIGNGVVLREDMTQTSGFISAIIGTRKVVGTIDPEIFLESEISHDIFQKWKDGTSMIIVITIGSTLGNKFTVNIPAARYTGVGYGTRGPFRTYDIGFECNRVSGDDEVTIKQVGV